MQRRRVHLRPRACTTEPPCVLLRLACTGGGIKGAQKDLLLAMVLTWADAGFLDYAPHVLLVLLHVAVVLLLLHAGFIEGIQPHWQILQVPTQQTRLS